MKIVFLSNKLTPHQIPFCEALYRMTDGEFVFVETTEDHGGLPVGWTADGSQYPFVISAKELYANREESVRLINEADVVLTGSAPEFLLKNRKESKALILRYSERPLKRSEPLKFIPRFLKWRLKGVDQKNIYMLCASAYTSSDYAKFGLFKNKCYQWGYFPKTVTYDNIGSLIDNKQKNSILWVARLIDWKHPEYAIAVAKKLRDDGYEFHLNIIGEGVLEEQLKRMIIIEKLEVCVHMLGAMSPENVRTHMERSEIFLFTSDRNEGWGAVLNESMNSACAVVAGHAIGAVPFLIQDTENGLIYKDGDVDDLYRKTKWLLDHSEQRKAMSRNAYDTIVNEWNAENAASKFTALAEKILQGEDKPTIFDDGVCSKAKILKDNWYQ